MDVIYEITAVGTDEEELYVSRNSEEIRIKVYLRMPSGEFFLRFKQQLGAATTQHVPASETHFWQMCRQLDAYIESIFQVDDTLTKITCPRNKNGLSKNRLMQRQSSEVVDRRFSTTSLNRIAEIPASVSQESLLSAVSSIPTSPPGTPRLHDDPELVVNSIPTDSSTWHRWFTVRNVFVLLDISKQTENQRIRHGMSGQLLSNARDQLIQDIRRLAFKELVLGKQFFFKVPGSVLNASLSTSHTANVLCRTNETLVGRMLSDPRIGAVTDSVNPFAVVELISSDISVGIARLNIGFFAMCPNMERMFVDDLSHRLSSGIVVDAPSPALRVGDTGVKHATTAKVQRATTTTPVLTGMGPGESFYTYSPDNLSLERYMLHHKWQVVCPPAIVLSDALTMIHERRSKEGWRCVGETSNSLVYVQILQQEKSSRIERNPEAADSSKLWVPRIPEVSLEPEPISKDVVTEPVAVDWDLLLRTPTSSPSKVRNSIRGPTICLSVQHSQVRGEKAYMKCQVWIDRGHPDWIGKTEEELSQFCQGLCAFE
jgi:hypothetical protein